MESKKKRTWPITVAAVSKLSYFSRTRL